MKKIGIVGSVFDKIFGVKIPYTSFFEQYGEVVILGPTIEVQEYVTNSDAEKLFDKYTGKFAVAIEELAESLKVPAEHVYNILIKDQIEGLEKGLKKLKDYMKELF